MKKSAKEWTRRFGTEAKFVSFNIPQLRSRTGKATCPYAGSCADICYAGQGRFTFKAALDVREKNLEKINSMSSSELIESISGDLSKMRKVTHVRIHDSGDFFNRSYYRSWLGVAENNPGMTFYAYTKSIPFIEWDRHPNNFRLVQSLGGKRDELVDYSRPHARIFSSELDRKSLGYCNGNDHDLPAILRMTKIGLVYHGVKSLTEDNLVQLRVA